MTTVEKPRPTAAHRKLEKLVGSWRGREIMKPSPWDPEGGEAIGYSEARVVANGFVVTGDYRQERDGVETFSGHAVYTWDPEREEYVHHWFDCMGSPPEVFRGHFDGDVLILEGKNPMGSVRSTVDFSQPDKMLVYYEMSTDGENWDCLFEGIYERQP
ncbi:MAG: DUF1579 domain-containing protein [Gammaproteobacteria bacterium]|nr:MAG: DUF1579 domain-containing protein [Gammaproteobacteria bacterium]